MISEEARPRGKGKRIPRSIFRSSDYLSLHNEDYTNNNLADHLEANLKSRSRSQQSRSNAEDDNTIGRGRSKYRGMRRPTQRMGIIWHRA